MILKHLYNMEKNDLFKIRAELAGMALQGLLADELLKVLMVDSMVKEVLKE